MVAGVLRENNARAHMHTRAREREFVAVCHCHAALPRVIANPDVRMLVAITALNAQEIKCSAEVIRRVNSKGSSLLGGWVEENDISYYLRQKRESTYADVYH